MNYKIDLHIHSLYSDGSYSTQELIEMLHQNNINIFSFTDHDSVLCYFDIMNGQAKLHDGMILIPGVEITCLYNQELKDILGYGIDPVIVDNYFQEKYSLAQRVYKQNLFIEQMKTSACKHNMIFDESIRATEGKRSEGFALMRNELNRYPENVARYPFIVDSIDFYWNYVNNPRSDFFVAEKEDALTFKEAIDLIHCAGGVAVIAHPYHYNMTRKDRFQMMEQLVDMGVDGVEIQHPSHTLEQVAELRDFAKQHNLLMSGGSDFHGAFKPKILLATGTGNVCVKLTDIETLLHKINVRIDL